MVFGLEFSQCSVGGLVLAGFRGRTLLVFSAVKIQHV